MANDYYTVASVPTTQSRGTSSTVRSEYAAVSAGFDKLPTPAQVWGNNGNYVAAGGSVDAWTASIASTYLVGYVDGMQIRVKFAAANTVTTPTINLNALGNKQIVSESGATLGVGDIAAGMIATLTYNSTSGKFQMTATAVANAAAAAASASAASSSASAASASASAASTSASSASTSASSAATSASAAASTISPVSVADYTALRAYAGSAAQLTVTGYLITSAPSATAGQFTADDTDTVSADNGGTIIVASNGKRWKRVYDGAMNVKWFGALGDASTDDTTALQAALTAASGGGLFIPDGTYVTSPLSMASDTELTFAAGAVLKAKTGYGANDKLLNITAVSNVTVFGNYGAVQMLKAEYLTGEQRHCVNITGSTNVTIYNLIAKDSGGDGFYIGSTPTNNNVALVNCIGDNNRRNGLSIVNVRNCLILGGVYKNTTGTAPQAGIDVESNLLDDYYLENVNIIGVKTNGNVGGGILITPQSKFFPVSINVQGCTSTDDGGDVRGGFVLNAAMAYTGATAAGLIGKIGGRVTLRDCQALNPRGSGFSSVNWTENAPDTLVENCYVLNPYSDATVNSVNRNKVGFLIRGETPSSGLFGTSVGNITIRNFTAVDDRAVKVMVIPIYFEPGDEADKPLKEITVDGLKADSTHWTSASLTPYLRAGSLATTNVILKYDESRLITTGSKTLGVTDIGATYTNTASATYTLPTAADYIGSSFSVRMTTAGANLQIVAGGTDVIANYSYAAATGLIARHVGAEITVKATAAGVWQVTNIVGGWGVSNFYGPRFPTTFNTAPPTSGTWAVGDVIFNKTPAAGQPAGWVCTVAGTPGTWVGFGQLPISATAAAIAAVGNAINTTGKYADQLVWDSTNNRMMRASGSAAADPWYVVDGSASVTPA